MDNFEQEWDDKMAEASKEYRENKALGAITALLDLHRKIDTHKLSEAYQIQNMIQDMISELEEIKENGGE